MRKRSKDRDRDRKTDRRGKSETERGRRKEKRRETGRGRETERVRAERGLDSSLGTRNKTYHKHDERKAQRTCKTDQSDHAEAAKYLRGAANVLLGRGEAQGQEERVSDDTRPSHRKQLCAPPKSTMRTCRETTQDA